MHDAHPFHAHLSHPVEVQTAVSHCI